MVWVNVDRDAPLLLRLDRRVAGARREHGLDSSAQQYAFEGEWEIHANWKVFLDNAIECYHCPTCHPGLADVLEMDPTAAQARRRRALLDLARDSVPKIGHRRRPTTTG